MTQDAITFAIFALTLSHLGVLGVGWFLGVYTMGGFSDEQASDHSSVDSSGGGDVVGDCAPACVDVVNEPLTPRPGVSGALHNRTSAPPRGVLG